VYSSKHPVRREHALLTWLLRRLRSDGVRPHVCIDPNVHCAPNMTHAPSAAVRDRDGKRVASNLKFAMVMPGRPC
jgi:hypothetical protein